MRVVLGEEQFGAFHLALSSTFFMERCKKREAIILTVLYTFSQINRILCFRERNSCKRDFVYSPVVLYILEPCAIVDVVSTIEFCNAAKGEREGGGPIQHAIIIDQPVFFLPIFVGAGSPGVWLTTAGQGETNLIENLQGCLSIFSFHLAAA